MRTIMIIGAGFGQVPAIKKAKELGLKVVVMDKDPNAIGMKLADIALPIDVVDQEGAISVAKKYKIDGVMTMQTDLPVPTIGAVVDALNLKGVSLKTANDCSNKIMTRQLFAEKNIPQPKFKVVSQLEEAQKAAESIGYPCIIKSPDSSGSRGVTKVQAPDDIKHAFEEAKKYARIDQILVEEYIEGIEIGAQTFSINGKCKIVLMHNDQLSEPPFMIPTGHSFPVSGFSDEEQTQVNADIAKAIEVLNILDGPANVDLIIDTNDNKVKIIEIGARIGATCLPELVNYHTGIDWIEAAIKTSLGEIPDLKVKKYKPVTAFILKAPKDGILLNYRIPYEVIGHPNVKEVEITANIGENVNELRKGTDRIGKIVVIGDSVEQADKLALDLIEKIQIEVK